MQVELVPKSAVRRLFGLGLSDFREKYREGLFVCFLNNLKAKHTEYTFP